MAYDKKEEKGDSCEAFIRVNVLKAMDFKESNGRSQKVAKADGHRIT